MKSFHQTFFFSKSTVHYVGDYVVGAGTTYYKDDLITDNGFLCIANKQTTDRPAPTQTSQSAYQLSDDITLDEITSKQYVIGNRYTAENNILFSGVKLYTLIGNEYSVYLVKDPTGSMVITQLFTFTAYQTGWQYVSVNSQYFPIGTLYSLMVVVSNPDTVVTPTYLNYNYLKPNNPEIPISGEIRHSNKEPNQIYINAIDNDLNDNYSYLSGLEAGDKIEAESTIWTIQAKQNLTTYFIFDVVPAVQLATTGIKQFTFNDVQASVISYDYNLDYWDTEGINAEGFEGPDIDNLTYNDSGYAIDGLIADLTFSEDWDILSWSSIAGAIQPSLPPSDGYAYGWKNSAYVKVEEKGPKLDIYSTDTVTLVTTGVPLTITGLTVANSYLIDVSDEYFRNVSGLSIALSGNISFNLKRATAGTSTIAVFYEKSTDLVTWTKDATSLNKFEFTGNSEGIESFYFHMTLDNQEYARIRFCYLTGDPVYIEEASETIETVEMVGYSFALNMKA